MCALNAGPQYCGAVVIPAHNEELVIGRCLDRLLGGVEAGELDVVVVANACNDSTADVARSRAVRVIETPVGGKAHALGLGDDACTVFPRIYLDADIEIDISSVRMLLTACSQPGVMACAPRPVWDLTGVGPIARRVHRVHDQLSGPYRALAGVGVYVLTASGHRRVFPIPRIISDDGYVHRSFSKSERVVVDGAASVIRPARSFRAHLRRRVRVRLGNAELTRLGLSAHEGRVGGARLWSLWRSKVLSGSEMVCYVVGAIAERALLVAHRLSPTKKIAWSTDDGSRTTPPATDA